MGLLIGSQDSLGVSSRATALTLAETWFFLYFIMKIAQGTYVFDEGF